MLYVYQVTKATVFHTALYHYISAHVDSLGVAKQEPNCFWKMPSHLFSYTVWLCGVFEKYRNSVRFSPGREHGKRIA